MTLVRIALPALALAGLDGCERVPDEDALPFVEQPEGEVPGIARFYATAVEHDGAIHDHILDARRILVRLVVSGVVNNRLRIKNRNIRREPHPQ